MARATQVTQRSPYSAALAARSATISISNSVKYLTQGRHRLAVGGGHQNRFELSEPSRRAPRLTVPLQWLRPYALASRQRVLIPLAAVTVVGGSEVGAVGAP
jgi:hypothetical protein